MENINLIAPSEDIRFSIVFNNMDSNKKHGRLFQKDGKLHFEGDVDKPAQVLFDNVCDKWNKQKEKLIIDLEEYDYTGSSNDIYGMVTKVNGVEMPFHNLDVDTILEQVLTHLGYEVEINRSYDRL